VGETQDFCSKCGTKIGDNTESTTCAKCGTNLQQQMSDGQVTPTKEEYRKSPVRKFSIILGIIMAIYTFFLIVSLIDYNVRLSTIRETAFGLGNLVIARVAPSIEISNFVGLLFLIETVFLFLRPKQGTIITLAVLSIVNILLTLWIINQIPQILYPLFQILSVGIAFNIITGIYCAVGYKKVA
jgi:hypothetical protein